MEPPCTCEFHFLLGRADELIVYQEKSTAWVGVPAFTTEERAREFVKASGLEIAEIASVAASDRESLATLINSVKRLTVRNLLLDLDYRTGRCTAVEFEGDRLGPAREWQFTPGYKR